MEGTFFAHIKSKAIVVLQTLQKMKYFALFFSAISAARICSVSDTERSFCDAISATELADPCDWYVTFIYWMLTVFF